MATRRHESRELFGGAVIADLPDNLIDASELRQIPNNQEVLLYPEPIVGVISIIVEVLQSVEPEGFTDAAKFHFDALAHDNSATSKTIKDISLVSNGRGDETPPRVLLEGTQQVSKHNNPIPDEVLILMAIYRIESKHADLVMTMNIATSLNGHPVVEGNLLAAAREDFDIAAKSLRILDFGLFA